MSEVLEKLRPDRDLQCYYERPSAIAAMHHAGPTGFRVTGTWRQQFDWAVIEWNRDNVFEHPALRNLPDGDLSGLVLSYEETRLNCIPIDSTLYPTVDWPYLRIWADDGSGEQFYQVPLKNYATPVEGQYGCATAELELSGTPTAGDYVGISFLEEHHTYQLYANDTLESAIQAIVASVNAFSPQMRAVGQGRRIRLIYVGHGQSPETSTTGANGNRIGVYGFVAGAKTEVWTPWWRRFSGGLSPQKWRITLPFGALTDRFGRAVPTTSVRKMRWTYAAELQDGEFTRSEFEVVVSNWSVTGARRLYQVAGPGSRRIEDDSPRIEYFGEWSRAQGNFSGGTISLTVTPGSGLRCRYRMPVTHRLYLGTRSTFHGAQIQITVDGQPAGIENLFIAGEDVLRRVYIAELSSGEHELTVTHGGAPGTHFYFDFVEMALPATRLPDFPSEPKLNLATDWDTDHSMALAAERTAWLIYKLGFHGRVNHYVGALWFYELNRPGHQYASATVEFLGTPEFSKLTELRIGNEDYPPEQDAIIQHVNRIGDTAETLAKAFELELNRGYTAVRARAEGSRLTVFARAMGAAGNKVTIAARSESASMQVVVSGPKLSGGADGDWRTDLVALPRLNRAVRDWSRAFYIALKNYGLDVVAAFSMELQHGDPRPEVGIAQRYPNGEPVWLNTPALQTNFSPTSLAFWRQVYLEMAELLAETGHQPYLQFGEVQWWYFPLAGSGMPFYDDYTVNTFQSTYGRPMRVIPSHFADPADFPEEVQFLPSLIGAFTAGVMEYVRSAFPNCRFEVLYPTDVNDTALNRLINYAPNWTPATLDCLKTESFTYTFVRNLDLSRHTISFPRQKGFPPAKRAFLVGLMDALAPWLKELRMALAENVESVVLFALDQFCLIGYPAPLPKSRRRSLYQG